MQNGTERVNGVLFYCLATYTGISYILQASRRPCGTYKAGWWLCAPLDSELGTRSSGLGVPLGNAEHGRRVAGDMRGTLDVDPNLNGILPLHLLVTLNTDPRSVVAQQVRQQKREGVAGGSVLTGVENPRSGRQQLACKGVSAAELMDVGLRSGGYLLVCSAFSVCTLLFSYEQTWHGQWGQCVSLTSSLHLFKTPGTPSSTSDTSGGGFCEFRRVP